MKDPLNFEAGRWTRVRCTACGWQTDVPENDDKLDRRLQVEKAIHGHYHVCPVIGPHLHEARKLFSSLNEVCEALNCTLEVLVDISGTSVRSERHEFKIGRGAVNVMPGVPISNNPSA